MKKTGLYIHIPFCIRKCAYCDFISYEGVLSDIKEKYVEALVQEMQEYCGEEIDTVYFGGGTPTTLETGQIERLMQAARDNFAICKDAEITIECNPKTADYDYFKRLKKCGINRLSIGVQSLNDDELLFLGRAHNREEAISCIKQAKEAGFDNFSVDVMFGLPCQTIDSVKKTIDGLIDLAPSHISCYSLIIEPNTPFFENGIQPLEEDSEREMQAFIVEYLKEKGYLRYEISNFAKGGKVSRHNIKYWENVPYIGIGAAASSYYKAMRYEKETNIEAYIENPLKRINLHKIAKEDEMSEFMFLGLRKTEGVSLSEFYENFGIEIEEKYDIKNHLKHGLLIKEDGRLFLSERGIDVSNAVLCDFV